MLLALFCLAGTAQKVKTWNEVVVGYSNVRILKVTKVTLYADRTEVALHLDFRAGQWMSVAKETYLQAGDKQYQVKDATVIKLGERYTLPTDTMNFVLTFNPVPQDTKKMDLIEPNGWAIMNMRSSNYVPEGITDTYWRNDATGDWLIGFAPKHVITMLRATGSSASHPSTLYIIIRYGTFPAKVKRKMPIR